MKCLNPCFNGRYSRSDAAGNPVVRSTIVLILVLMKDTLGEHQKKLGQTEMEVLILVLMEDTLGVAQ